MIGVKRMSYFKVSPNATIDTGITVPCLLMSSNLSRGYTIGLHIIYGNMVFKEIESNSLLVYGNSQEDETCILVSEEWGNIIIKNNTTSEIVVYLYALSL